MSMSKCSTPKLNPRLSSVVCTISTMSVRRCLSGETSCIVGSGGAAPQGGTPGHAVCSLCVSNRIVL